MAKKSARVYQHTPLPIPYSWREEERRFSYELELMLDDIYRRFNRLSLKDLSDSLQQLIISTSQGLITNVSGENIDLSSVLNTLSATLDTHRERLDGIDTLIEEVQADVNEQFTDVNADIDTVQSLTGVAQATADEAKSLAQQALTELDDKVSVSQWNSVRSQISAISGGLRIRSGAGSTADYSDAEYENTPVLFLEDSTVTVVSKTKTTATFSASTGWISIGR